MSELDRIMRQMAEQGITVSTSARAEADSIAGRIQASAERVGNTIPCGNPRCSLTRAHDGPCLDSSADPTYSEEGDR